MVKIMLRKILFLLTILSIALVLISCSTLKKNKAARDTEMNESERITERELVDEGDTVAEEEIASFQEEAAGSDINNILFDYDRYNIREDAKPILDNVASLLNKERKMNVVIEGHSDERGTNEYNLALGEKRARATQNYLQALGVSLLRVKTVSYGEEKPLCTYQAESCWQSNRRSSIKFSDLD
jgi:peptidoglycan-associated lipoprotein